MTHTCFFYSILRCEFFKECGEVSSFTCNHGGGHYYGRWKDKKEGPVKEVLLC
jgi:hypothetical protein